MDQYNEWDEIQTYYGEPLSEVYGDSNYVPDNILGETEGDFNGEQETNNSNNKGLFIWIISIFLLVGVCSFFAYKHVEENNRQVGVATVYINDFQNEIIGITEELNLVLDDKFSLLEEEDVEYFQVLGEIMDAYYLTLDSLEIVEKRLYTEVEEHYISEETLEEMVEFTLVTIDEVNTGIQKALEEMKSLYTSILEIHTKGEESIESLTKSILNIEKAIEMITTEEWSQEYLSQEDYDELIEIAENMLIIQEESIENYIDYTKAGLDGVISFGTKSEEELMVERVNTLRKMNGLDTLTYDSNLYKLAQIRGVEISESFSHTRPDGTDCLTVSDDMAGENISCNSGDYSAKQSYQQFYDSADHKENMLYAHYTRIACNRVIANGTAYWVQIFGF